VYVLNHCPITTKTQKRLMDGFVLGKVRRLVVDLCHSCTAFQAAECKTGLHRDSARQDFFVLHSCLFSTVHKDNGYITAHSLLLATVFNVKIKTFHGNVLHSGYQKSKRYTDIKFSNTCPTDTTLNWGEIVLGPHIWSLCSSIRTE
jgi:hypothetical protein